MDQTDLSDKYTILLSIYIYIYILLNEKTPRNFISLLNSISVELHTNSRYMQQKQL